MALRLDQMRSSPERPGFQVLADDPPNEVAVGAIGKVWKLDIPFVHVADDLAFSRFSEPGFVKVAWCVRVDPRPEGGAWITFDLRVDATDEESLEKFRRYWRLIGPFSHAIRHELLRLLGRELGRPPEEAWRGLPGDELIPTIDFQRTHSITIEAPKIETPR